MGSATEHARTAPLERLPRWLAGDWGRLLRDPVDVLRLALAVGAIATAAMGPREQSVRLALTFMIALIPRAAAAPRPFDFAFVLALSFQAWGNVFGAFDALYGYDKIVHFVLPSALAPVLYLTLVRLSIVPDFEETAVLHRRAGMALLTFALGFTLGGGLYELYEWVGNHYLGAHLYVGYGDSIGDLVDDALGSMAGAALLLLWQARGWGTTRRPRLDGAEDPVEETGDRIAHALEPDEDATPRRKHAPTPPRWLAGDWRGPVRDPLDLLRLSFAAGALAASAEGEWELAARFALTFAAAVSVRALDVPRPFDLAFLVAMSVQAWGSYLEAFESITGYGPAVHVLVSAAAAPVLYVALIRLRLVPDLAEARPLHHVPAIACLAFSFGFSVGVLYELYVYSANEWLGASFPVDYPTFIERLALDALGALIGAALMVVWATAGWTTRRVPGQ